MELTVINTKPAIDRLLEDRSTARLSRRYRSRGRTKQVRRVVHFTTKTPTWFESTTRFLLPYDVLPIRLFLATSSSRPHLNCCNSISYNSQCRSIPVDNWDWKVSEKHSGGGWTPPIRRAESDGQSVSLSWYKRFSKPWLLVSLIKFLCKSSDAHAPRCQSGPWRSPSPLLVWSHLPKRILRLRN